MIAGGSYGSFSVSSHKSKQSFSYFTEFSHGIIIGALLLRSPDCEKAGKYNMLGAVAYLM